MKPLGVDFSEEFVERAREHAGAAGVTDRVGFHVHDMRNLASFDGSFDLVTNFWNSLGYYDKETDVEILSEMQRLCSENGTVAIEMSNKEFVVQNYGSSSVREVDDKLHAERKQFNLRTGRFETTVDVFADEGSKYRYLDTLEFEPRIYAPVELREMCERAGFDEVRLFGGFEGKDLSLDSPRVVVLAW
ncbi:class I SAM-dependent methyltransferase [Haloferax sp. S1W]|uniref:class I SAM-dependent methyltransferase n=1 Tax=Haloferax sp. S1W TaxID=3377110 RepID=UPI0037CA4280